MTCRERLDFRVEEAGGLDSAVGKAVLVGRCVI
jgi:hypothetical protein